MHISQRKSKALKTIAPGLDEESLCEKKSHRKRACVETEQKRKEMDEIILLLCQDDTPWLSSDANNYPSGILGKNGDNAATNSYHGDDNNYDDSGERYDEEGDAVLLKQPRSEYSQCRSIRQMTITVDTGTILQLPCLDHRSD